jgi:hypothetical protein
VKALVLLCSALSLTGCLFHDSLEKGESEPTPAPTPTLPPTQPAARPPSFGSVTIADWPPIGKTSGVQASVSDPDSNLSTVELSFKNKVTRAVSGGSATVSATGSELGEGFGTLTLTARDTTTAFARRTVLDLLVDLTPPEITLGQTVVAASGSLELWVGDAWILGKVELEFGGELLTHAFEPGYPSTVGNTWDYSLVKFPMAELPAVEDEATIKAVDAAGNSVSETFTLVIDGAPPLVAITSPAEGATASGKLSVTISASDAGDGPVWIELSLGGTPVANGTGPSATLSIDTTEFAPGPTQLTAIATDRAGNQSTISRSIVIQ